MHAHKGSVYVLIVAVIFVIPNGVSFTVLVVLNGNGLEGTCTILMISTEINNNDKGIQF